MNEDGAWRAVDAQRTALADLLAGLYDTGWRTPSLCAGWTVRDVAAHITFQHGGLPVMLLAVLRARGDMDRAIRDSAVRRAARREPDRLVADIRAMVGSRRRPPVVTYAETLIDALVHAQDVAVPLGVAFPMPADAAAHAADRVWAKDHFAARTRFTGVRLTATDTAWTAGDGEPVEAPMEALLMVLCGRSVAVPRLTGPGARRFRT